MTDTPSVMSPERVDLQGLFQRCLGNLELAERVLHAFEGHFEEDLDELEQTLQANRWDAASQLAHRMKGASSNVSAVDIVAELSRLEESVRAEAADSSRAAIERLREQWDRFQLAEKDFGMSFSNDP